MKAINVENPYIMRPTTTCNAGEVVDECVVDDMIIQLIAICDPEEKKNFASCDDAEQQISILGEDWGVSMGTSWRDMYFDLASNHQLPQDWSGFYVWFPGASVEYGRGETPGRPVPVVNASFGLTDSMPNFRKVNGTHVLVRFKSCIT